MSRFPGEKRKEKMRSVKYLVAKSILFRKCYFQQIVPTRSLKHNISSICILTTYYYNHCSYQMRTCISQPIIAAPFGWVYARVKVEKRTLGIVYLKTIAFEQMETLDNRERFAHKMKIQEKIHRRQTKNLSLLSSVQ